MKKRSWADMRGWRIKASGSHGLCVSSVDSRNGVVNVWWSGVGMLFQELKQARAIAKMYGCGCKVYRVWRGGK